MKVVATMSNFELLIVSRMRCRWSMGLRAKDIIMDDIIQLRRMCKTYGELESLNTCDNLADHMVDNVYVQFNEEDQAANALKNLTGRFYAGRPIIIDFSPVTDFREVTCRQYEENNCNRGGYYNFMHLKRIGRELRRHLYGRYRRSYRSRSRSRSRSPYMHKSYDARNEIHAHSRGMMTGITTMRIGAGGAEVRPNRRRGRSRSRSPGGKRDRSPARDNSEERRAIIEQWNREKEETNQSIKVNNDDANRNRRL